MEATKQNNGTWDVSGIPSWIVSYNAIIDLLKKGSHFKFARYGDGELNCMIGKKGTNCDKHEYFPDLGERLRDSLFDNPKYSIGLQPLTISNPILFDKWNRLTDGLRLNICNADVLHNASICGILDGFINVLHERNVILVGPPHLSGIFQCKHIAVNPVNAWLSYDITRDMVEDYILNTEYPVILLSCGMMAEVLIHEFKDHNITMIDTGSVFDPLVGVKSRSYHHKLKL